MSLRRETVRGRRERPPAPEGVRVPPCPWRNTDQGRPPPTLVEEEELLDEELPVVSAQSLLIVKFCWLLVAVLNPESTAVTSQ
jgi:hypothetical protein